MRRVLKRYTVRTKGWVTSDCRSVAAGLRHHGFAKTSPGTVCPSALALAIGSCDWQRTELVVRSCRCPRARTRPGLNQSELLLFGWDQLWLTGLARRLGVRERRITATT
jgi:hypothetical protein